MAKKPVTDKEPIMWGHRYWSYRETDMGGVKAITHVVGFLLLAIGDLLASQSTFMKNLFAMIFFVIVTMFPSGIVFAFGDIGSWGNPLYIQNQNGFLQQNLLNALNSQTEAINNATYQAQIRSLQGVPECESQYNGALNSYVEKMQKMDMGNPIVAQQAGSYTNYIKNSYLTCLKNNQQTTCQSGYVVKNGSCVTPDVGCKATYGQYSKFDKYDSTTGYPVCGCSNGYEWNSNGSSCTEIKTVNMMPSLCSAAGLVVSKNNKCVTKTESCQEYYGINSVWNGTTNAQGGLVCGCSVGYEWSQDGGSCVATPVAPVKTNNQICADAYGVNSIFTEVDKSNGKITCDCGTGYKWNQGQTQCIVAPKKNISKEQSADETPIIIETFNYQGYTNSFDQRMIDPSILTVGVATKVDQSFRDNEVTKSTEDLTSKGLWARIKNWFRF